MTDKCLLNNNYNNRGGRNSNIELYRIFSMLLIVAHHYVVNSNLWTEDAILKDPECFKSLYYLIFGMWGKTGINCFVLITGYFMCKSAITLKKFLKLLLEIYFYKIIIYLIFLSFGYVTFSALSIFRILNPINSVAYGFTSAYLVFFLFIPFLTILVNNMDKQQHRYLMLLSLFVYTILGSIPGILITFNYLTWFCVLFIIASYIRIYGLFNKMKHKYWGILTLLSLFFSICSVLFMVFIVKGEMGLKFMPFYLVSDSNKILALMTSVTSFMYFKDLHLKHSKIINTIAASTFGVLLIHANSEAMRQWLWNDMFENVSAYYTSYAYVRPIIVVLFVFSICVILDYLRIRFIENPVMNYISIKIDARKKPIIKR